ncbi:hypothetical protein AAB990_22290 [Burkholderia contaminans]|uniref:hypothetical protein n=1 Tax=Burkholderia contaminans TaxID=488447 RepID=UPI002417D641|nr:hypothetical protein [Burkholderia contaminans]WFN15770.1 hypothetical protein LXE92_40730 [Burkholderia contaminans]
MKHLQTLAPKLFAKLEKANENSLRKICYRVCDYAATANRPHDPLIDEAIGYLRLGNEYRQGMVTDLDELMNRLDERYFDLKDRADEMVESPDCEQLLAESDEYFRKARVAAALRVAVGSDAFEAATESIYEAAASVDNNVDVFDLAASLI